MKKLKLSVLLSVVFSIALIGLSCVTESEPGTCNLFCRNSGGWSSFVYPSYNKARCTEEGRNRGCRASWCLSSTDCTELYSP